MGKRREDRGETSAIGTSAKEANRLLEVIDCLFAIPSNKRCNAQEVQRFGNSSLVVQVQKDGECLEMELASKSRLVHVDVPVTQAIQTVGDQLAFLKLGGLFESLLKVAAGTTVVLAPARRTQGQAVPAR